MREPASARGPLRRWVVAILLLGAVSCAVVRPSRPDVGDPIALAVLPRVGLGPRDVSVTVRVDKDPSNRNVCLAFVQGDDDVIASCHSLNGDKEPRFWQHIFYQVQAGAYTVEVRVTRADKSVWRVRVPVCYAGQLHESCGPSESAE